MRRGQYWLNVEVNREDEFEAQLNYDKEVLEEDGKNDD